ncbi:helix-turn-helix transcriptional regulator [Pseudonocardia eucalypti]|uniref:Helix-turn-helix transcriptional regulator n=1 Tax=Pseudonocardia eucalypti TaxID=648755 RepID=A0ABP9R766_9PSEU|nr:transcriptional regulator with XRE-family HTH domain [Pseudonocardia eucalypti]
MSRRELADFLRRRREALRPEQVSLPHPADRRGRRTPGLRREEVAALAGMSANYYERLEQARAPRPSPQVLAALGAALRLTGTEREHLARLAGQAPTDGRPTEPAEVPAHARRLLDQLAPIPGYLVDERQDIVAWNAQAAALITDFGRLPARERNVVRLSIRLGGTVCAAPDGAGTEFARQAAAELRAATARHPARPALGELVNEFAAHDPDFAASWREHDVRPRPVLRKLVRHPELGELELDCQTLLIPGSDLRLVIYTADPGSPSAAKLARLA